MRVGLSDTILKGTHLGTIPARFGLIRFRGFRGEDLNVKVYDIRRTDAGRQVMEKAKKKRCTRLTATSDKVYQLLAHGRWFSPGTPASSFFFYQNDVDSQAYK